MQFRIALIDDRGRTAGHLRYRDGAAQWPTGHEVLGDLFTEDAAQAEHAGWEAWLAAKGTGYTVKVVPVAKAAPWRGSWVDGRAPSRGRQ